MRRVKIKQGITPEQFGAEPEYFNKYIKSKTLTVVYESTSGYIRVQDQNGEEWGLFKAQYKKIEPAVVQKETGAPGIGGHPKPDYQWELQPDR
jgi:hypothetical protein